MTTDGPDGRRKRPRLAALRRRVSAGSGLVFVLVLVAALVTTGVLVPGAPGAGEGDAGEQSTRPTGDAVDRSNVGGDGGGESASAPLAALRSARTEAASALAGSNPGDGDEAEAAAGRPPRGLVDPAENGSNDADGDGLRDGAERDVYGTDPTDADTDGDGFPDGMEVACDTDLPGADPLHHDLFVEVDVVSGATLEPAVVNHLRDAFADAPVENPDGETGIALHVWRSDADLPMNGSIDSGPRAGDHNDLGDYRAAYADHDESGYYYVVVTTEAAFRGDDYYAGAGVHGAAVAESFDSPRITGSLLMHELGHAFGLGPEKTGVDEERYDREEYRSVMNYNGIYELSTYSDGADDVGRDEWSFVSEERYRPPTECGDGSACAVACAASE